MFSLSMREGLHVADLTDHVAAIGGRFNLISVSGRFAVVTVFSPDDVIGHALRARSWPGVAVSQLSVTACADWAPSWCYSRSWLTIPVPVDTGAAVPGDGIVQVRSGDTVTISYSQPDGGALEAKVQVP
jgi:hypothetical protein